MTPALRILAMYAVVPVLAAVASLPRGLSQSAWVLVLPILGATIGPWMGLTVESQKGLFEGIFPLLLILGVVVGVMGWRRRARLAGQIVAAVGFSIWTLAGMWGLSTGT